MLLPRLRLWAQPLSTTSTSCTMEALHSVSKCSKPESWSGAKSRKLAKTDREYRGEEGRRRKPVMLEAASQTLLLTRKYVLWRFALVYERLFTPLCSQVASGACLAHGPSRHVLGEIAL